MDKLRFVYKHYRMPNGCIAYNANTRYIGRHGRALHYRRGGTSWSPLERGGYTLCYIYDQNGSLVSSAVAECSPKDNFCYRTGRAIAKIRAECALVEGGVEPYKRARLSRVSRGFGGDNAWYDTPDGELAVAVSWALLCPFSTEVWVHGQRLIKYDDRRYIQPPEALSRLGYVINGDIDFAAAV